MRGILDTADAEGRPLSSDETQKHDRIETDVNAFSNTIDRREKLSSAESMVASAGGEARVSQRNMTKAEKLDSSEYRNAFEKYIRFGANSLIGEEARALQEGTDSEGGYLTETVLERRLIETLADMNIMRQLASVINTSSDRNIPVESSIGAATWTAEEASYSENDPVFAVANLGAHKIGKIVKISDELMQDSVFDMSSYLGRNLGRAIAEAEEAAFVNGDGSSKPTGVTAGASAGVTAAGTGAVTSNEIYDLAYSLKRQYRRNGAFLMHDSTIKAIRQLKDSNGQYLWQPALTAGEPDTLAGRPVYASYDMPEMATGNIAALFGDFKMGYLIADRGATSFLRLNELYAASGQTAVRASRRVDGKVVLAESIKKLTMA